MEFNKDLVFDINSITDFVFGNTIDVKNQVFIEFH